MARAAAARAPVGPDPARAAADPPVAVPAEDRPVRGVGQDQEAQVPAEGRPVRGVTQDRVAPAAMVPVDPDRATAGNKKIRVREWGWAAFLPAVHSVYYSIQSFAFLNPKLSFLNKITPFFSLIQKFSKKCKKKCNLFPSSAFNG